MKIKKSVSYKLFDLLNIVIMLLLMIVCLYPLVHVLFASISSSQELMAHQGVLLHPLGFNLGAYKEVVKDPMIGRGYLNTILIVVVGVTVNIVLTSICAYFLSRKNMVFQKGIMMMIIFTMFFGGGMIPLYLTVKGIHLYNTFWALIFPVAINTFNMIIMRTSFASVPEALEEAARMDGAGHVTILCRVMLPLSLPVVAVMILYYTVGHWNSWFNAMLFLQDRELYPLQIILREILIINDTSNMTMDVGAMDVESAAESVKYAVIIVATLPILCLYPFLQKYFVKGVMVGSVKG